MKRWWWFCKIWGFFFIKLIEENRIKTCLYFDYFIPLYLLQYDIISLTVSTLSLSLTLSTTIYFHCVHVSLSCLSLSLSHFNVTCLFDSLSLSLSLPTPSLSEYCNNYYSRLISNYFLLFHYNISIYCLWFTDQ